MSKQEVVICHNLEENLQKAVTSKTYDKLFILTDEHTRTYCLPIIEKYPFLAQAEHICRHRISRRQARARVPNNGRAKGF